VSSAQRGIAVKGGTRKRSLEFRNLAKSRFLYIARRCELLTLWRCSRSPKIRGDPWAFARRISMFRRFSQLSQTTVTNLVCLPALQLTTGGRPRRSNDATNTRNLIAVRHVSFRPSDLFFCPSLPSVRVQSLS